MQKPAVMVNFPTLGLLYTMGTHGKPSIFRVVISPMNFGGLKNLHFSMSTLGVNKHIVQKTPPEVEGRVNPPLKNAGEEMVLVGSR